jgi:hypothetical protein
LILIEILAVSGERIKEATVFETVKYRKPMMHWHNREQPQKMKLSSQYKCCAFGFYCLNVGAFTLYG